MDLRRWTPLIIIAPGRYLSADPFWEAFDLEDWSADTYEWTADPWNGFLDLAKRPAETVSAGRGDCEDYALVAASWAIATGHEGVGLGFCWQVPYPWPTHAIAFDAERVYSSGEVFEGSVGEWLEEEPYDRVLRRRVT